MNSEQFNLGQLNLNELNTQEIEEVEGGNFFKRLLDAAAIYDAVSDFRDGWNSVPSYSRGVSSGGW